jgi:hypothetical protein
MRFLLGLIAASLPLPLYGRYEFRKPPEPVDVDEIVRELAQIRIGAEAALAA